MREIKFDDAIITIEVGAQRVEFKVAKQLLCQHSAFFRAALNGSFKEAQEKLVRLADVNPETFFHFVQWLYNGRKTDTKAKKGSDRLSPYIALYALAARLIVPKMQNQLIDDIYAMVEKGNLSVDHIVETWDATSTSCKLRQLVLEEIMKKSWTNAVYEEAADRLDKDILCELGKGFISGRLRKRPSRNKDDSSTLPPAKRSKTYHVDGLASYLPEEFP